MANPFSFGRYRSPTQTNGNQSSGPSPIILQTEQDDLYLASFPPESVNPATEHEPNIVELVPEPVQSSPEIDHSGVVISGRVCARVDTTENWNAQPDFIPLKGEIIVYKDSRIITDDLGNEIPVPDIKIGDGDAYLIDLPFVGDDIRYTMLRYIRNHTENSDIHVTAAEKAYWDQKLDIELIDTRLVFNRITFNRNET